MTTLPGLDMVSSAPVRLCFTFAAHLDGDQEAARLSSQAVFADAVACVQGEEPAA